MSLIIARAFATMALVMVLTPATAESFNQPLQEQCMSQSGGPAQVPGADSREPGDTGKGPADLHPLWRTPLLAHAAKAVTSNWAGLR